MAKLFCKYGSGHYAELGLKFKDGVAEVSSEKLAEVKKSKHYGSEIGTAEDANWLDKEQKLALVAKPKAAPKE